MFSSIFCLRILKFLIFIDLKRILIIACNSHSKLLIYSLWNNYLPQNDVCKIYKDRLSDIGEILKVNVLKQSEF